MHCNYRWHAKVSAGEEVNLSERAPLDAYYATDVWAVSSSQVHKQRLISFMYAAESLNARGSTYEGMASASSTANYVVVGFMA